jgi:hypothetical protein
MRSCVIAFGCLVTLAIAALPALAQAQAAPPVSVWFRSAAGCPDGNAFLSALQARAVGARLAQVGDAIDFVVTLGTGADGGASGVLERQTQTGTVAIRRVDDASCDQVADALALTLALSVQGGDGESPGATTPAPAAAPALLPAPASVDPATAAPATTALGGPAVSAPAETTSAERPATKWAIGLAALAATGLAPELVPGGSAFAELGWDGGSALLRPALRIGALASFGSTDEAGREFELRILGGRIAGCPLALGAGALTVRPCLALQLGQLHGSGEGPGGRSASGVWAASEAAARLSVLLTARFSLEVEAGLLVPWTRYTLRTADGAAIHRMAGLGAAAHLGAAVHFW